MLREFFLQKDMGNLINFGIAMIDLNNLKVINDTYGHEEGNYAIKKLCEIVCSVFLIHQFSELVEMSLL